MVQINAVNHNMIMDIMGNLYEIENNQEFTKYANNFFDIVVKNNSSIIVIDKRDTYTDGIPIVYKDLRIAHTNIVFKPSVV